jgi:hypothetical protein
MYWVTTAYRQATYSQPVSSCLMERTRWRGITRLAPASIILARPVHEPSFRRQPVTRSPTIPGHWRPESPRRVRRSPAENRDPQCPDQGSPAPTRQAPGSGAAGRGNERQPAGASPLGALDGGLAQRVEPSRGRSRRRCGSSGATPTSTPGRASPSRGEPQCRGPVYFRAVVRLLPV